jgi:hypothetical protein
LSAVRYLNRGIYPLPNPFMEIRERAKASDLYDSPAARSVMQEFDAELDARLDEHFLARLEADILSPDPTRWGPARRIAETIIARARR